MLARPSEIVAEFRAMVLATPSHGLTGRYAVRTTSWSRRSGSCPARLRSLERSRGLHSAPAVITRPSKSRALHGSARFQTRTAGSAWRLSQSGGVGAREVAIIATAMVAAATAEDGLTAETDTDVCHNKRD